MQSVTCPCLEPPPLGSFLNLLQAVFKCGLSTEEGLRIWDIMREVGGMESQSYVDAFRPSRFFFLQDRWLGSMAEPERCKMLV